jgi:FMN-dependent NADH-azoreductase
MTAILQILVSPRPRAFSRQVARDIVARIEARHPGAQIIERDLSADPPPHPNLDLYEAILSPTPDDDPRLELSERLIAELEVADFIVIGTPMNNFTVPSTLKAWIDHIVRIRRTFRSSPEGKIGILRDRPLIVVSAHGGYCSDIPPGQPDFLTPYLRAIFATIGIETVNFLRLEGMSRGPDAVLRSLELARGWIEQDLPKLLGWNLISEGLSKIAVLPAWDHTDDLEPRMRRA